MDLPVYFKLDGKFAVMLPESDGGVSVAMSAGAPSIADFMRDGMIIDESEVPTRLIELAKADLPSDKLNTAS